MKRLPGSLLIVLTMAIAGCSDRGLSGPVGPIDRLPRALTPEETRLLETNNQFTFRLFQRTNAENAGKNVFISPLSAAMALGMTYNGARGTTEDAMRTTLGLEDLTNDQINQSYRGAIDLLRELDPGVTFQIANSIWYRQTFTVETPFLDLNRKYFDAEVSALDFASGTAHNTVNAWVNDKTNGRIPGILEASDFNEGAMMFLVNAIYFKGAWTQQFEKSKTAPAPFTLENGSTVSVPMMNKDRGYSTGAHDEVQVVDIPYSGGAYSMTILLPAQTETVDALAARLDQAWWAGATANLVKREGLNLSLPRFKLEFTTSMKPALEALGMGIAFTDAADFTGISRAGGLLITKVRQKAYVDVNEEGTEAAAATAVGVGVTSAPMPVEINRPFLFAIREKYSGAILFLGKVINPVLTN